jgi:hypothetical protein
MDIWEEPDQVRIAAAEQRVAELMALCRGAGDESYDHDREELARLRRENRELLTEREILRTLARVLRDPSAVMALDCPVT